jgi:hypothetical protein
VFYWYPQKIQILVLFLSFCAVSLSFLLHASYVDLIVFSVFVISLPVFLFCTFHPFFSSSCCYLTFLYLLWPIPVAARSKEWVCGCSLAGIADSNPAGGMDVCCECCVLSGRGLCDGPITRPEEFHWVWCVWVWSRNLNNEEPRPTLGCRATKKKLSLHSM